MGRDMVHGGELSERERQVLEAVIHSYVATAEPAGSRTLSRRFGLGISPATIRGNTTSRECFLPSKPVVWAFAAAPIGSSTTGRNSWGMRWRNDVVEPFCQNR